MLYRMEELKGMTTYHLKEICCKERIVVPMGTRLSREEMIQFIMRYRGIYEHRNISKYRAGGIEALQEFIDKTKLVEDHLAQVSFPAHLVLYKEEAIEPTDHYEVNANIDLYEGNVLLTDEHFNIKTCMYIKRVQDKKFFLLKGKNVEVKDTQNGRYFILYFKREEVSEMLYEVYNGKQVSIPGQISCVITPLLDVDVRCIEETDTPLIIDFGSSNTTMGTYSENGENRIVRVADLSADIYRESELIPSIIGIKDIVENTPEYCFGYEAKVLSEHFYHDEDNCVFYDIKRWISDPKRYQQVIGRNGMKMQLSRSVMIFAFMNYLIDTAQQQFKCKFKNIQLLAPVRQTKHFEIIFKQILPDKNIECTLDEGRAVLFQSIYELINSESYKENFCYKALIMDCGGGTTDLTSGNFSIRSSRMSYEIDIETGYENGNTNFGGNNLTFRILQLLKVKLLEALEYKQFYHKTVDLKEITGLYEQAEKILPTRFAEYELKSREEYFRVKNNYYYLFKMAQLIKESFFQKTIQYEITVGTQDNVKNNKGIHIDKWKLSVKEKDEIASLRKEASFELYLYEIERLLRPDIYELMKRFLNQPFMEGSLSKYQMFKLTGQSCKSELFVEALKEYVPGILIKNRREDAYESRLKMCCLEGAINYFKSCKLGYMKINHTYKTNVFPYEITAYTHENREKVLIHSLSKERDIGYISRFKAGGQLDLYLNDENGDKLKVYHFKYSMDKFKSVTQKDFDEKYSGTVIQQETDIIHEGEIKFFVWTANKEWGFVVLPVLRDNELLKQGEETFFPFEDDTWEENFFDGRK